MNTRNEKAQLDNPSKRARLDTLLFNGTKVGTTLLAPGVSTDPKYPIAVGE